MRNLAVLFIAFAIFAAFFIARPAEAGNVNPVVLNEVLAVTAHVEASKKLTDKEASVIRANVRSLKSNIFLNARDYHALINEIENIFAQKRVDMVHIDGILVYVADLMDKLREHFDYEVATLTNEHIRS